MTASTITDWIQSSASVVALLLSGGSLYWQYRTARQARTTRLTCEAERLGPAVWRLQVSYEADDRSAVPMLTAEVLNSGQSTELIPNGAVSRVSDQYGGFTLDIAGLFDLKASRKLEVEMAHRQAPSNAAVASIFIRNPVESEPLRMRFSVKSAGKFWPAIKRTLSVTPIG